MITLSVRPILKKIALFLLALVSAFSLSLSSFQPARAAVTVTLTPITWDVVGLDSNSPTSGPQNFPVGVRVCYSGVTAPTSIATQFVWDSENANIDLRPGSLQSTTINVTADDCTDVYYEVQVNRVNAAYNTDRRYHIEATVGGVTYSTPTPRQIFVEHLVSQSRNYNFNVIVDGVSIPVGGAMNLSVGSTYTITLESKTAPGGYGQIESFINFPNTIFQVISVNSTYSAPVLGTTSDMLYYDACSWYSDPGNPYYRSCEDDGKAGGSITNTYVVKIIGGGGTSENLYNMVYDFSGSSYHYNSDYATSFRIANIIDPNALTIAKNFSPDPMSLSGSTVLTFTITNPNAAAVNEVDFTDNLNAITTNPGTLAVANPAGVSTSGCGTPTVTAAPGSGSISLTGATIAANGGTCTVKVNVVASAVSPALNPYQNTTGPLTVGGVSTGKTASDTVAVTSDPIPPAPTCGWPAMAQWTVPSTATNPPDTGGSVTAPVSPGNASIRAADVTTAIAWAGSGFENGTIISSSYGSGDTYSWKADGGVTPGTTFSTANNEYFAFQVDTRKYTTITLSFYAYHRNNGPQNVYIYYSTSGTAPGTLKTGPISIPSDSTWYPINVTFTATETSTTGNTTFFIYAANSNNSNKGSDFHLDNIMVSGCKIPAYPTLVKSFATDPVGIGATSTLNFLLSNPNTVPLSNVSFSDTLPTGISVASSGPTTVCGGSLTTSSPSTITFSGGTLNASSSCTIPVTITATTAGTHTNISGSISTTQTGTNSGASGYGTASLTAILPPVIHKQFTPNPIPAGGVSTIEFTITNPNGSKSLTGVGFRDPASGALPGGMTVAGGLDYLYSLSGCGAPTSAAPVAGDSSYTFSGGTIDPGATCIIRINVTAPTAGSYVNTTGAVSASITGSGNTATDTLAVNPLTPAISLLKSIALQDGTPWVPFVAASTPGQVWYQFVVENTGDAPLSSVTISDPPLTITCPLSILAKYETMTCKAGPISTVDGEQINNATVSGTYGTATVTDTSSAKYGTTGITIVKTAAETAFVAAGDVLHYSYLVTNDGFYPLETPATVTDDKTSVTCPSAVGVGDLDTYLDRDETITCTAAYTVTAADVTNGSVTNTAWAAARVANLASNATTGNVSVTVNKTTADYGDLPAVYDASLQGKNGARHTTGSLFIGTAPSADADGQEGDMASLDSDDGVSPYNMTAKPWLSGNTVDVQVDLRTATTASGNANICLWVDWNGSDTDYNLPLWGCQLLATGDYRIMSLQIPTSYVNGTRIFVRARAFDPATPMFGGPASIGLANNGEVEDYLWQINPTAVELIDFKASPTSAPLTLYLLAGGLAIGLLILALLLRRRKK